MTIKCLRSEIFPLPSIDCSPHFFKVGDWYMVQQEITDARGHWANLVHESIALEPEAKPSVEEQIATPPVVVEEQEWPNIGEVWGPELTSYWRLVIGKNNDMIVYLEFGIDKHLHLSPSEWKEWVKNKQCKRRD